MQSKKNCVNILSDEVQPCSTSMCNDAKNGDTFYENQSRKIQTYINTLL